MKKMLILLLCSLLLVGSMTAQAALPSDVYSRNHALEWTLTLSPDADALLALIQGDNPLSKEFPAAWRKQESSDAMNALKTLLDGVSKLRIQGAFAPWALSLSLGTDQAGLAAASLWADPKTGGNGAVIDLMDYVFCLPQDQVKPALHQAASLMAVDVPGLVRPYLTLLKSEADRLLHDKTPEEGSFSVGEFGSFDHKASVTVTRHDAAGILKSLLTAFENDADLQTAITWIAAISLPDDARSNGSLSAQFANALQSLIAQLLSEEDGALLELSACSRAEGGAVCYAADTSKALPDVALRLAVMAGEKQGGLLLTAGDGTRLDGAGTPQGIDWEKVYVDATEGSGQGKSPLEESAHLALQYSVPEDGQTALSLWVYSAGMRLIGAVADHCMRQAEPYQSDIAIRLSAFGDAPVLSFNLTLRETDKLPALPDTGSWPVLSLTDDDLKNKVDIGNLPTLLLRCFSMAFPDTAEDLIKAAQSFGD